jgi:hypothetical protein
MANLTSSSLFVVPAVTSALRHLRIFLATTLTSPRLAKLGAIPKLQPEDGWLLGQLFILISIAGIFYTATALWFAERDQFRLISGVFEEWPF